MKRDSLSFLFLFSYRQGDLFPLNSFRVFLFVLILCHLNRLCLDVSILECSWLVFSELSGSVVWYMSLVWENSQLLLLQYFFCMLFPLFSFSYSHYTYITPFVTFSQFLDSPYCLFTLFSLWISYLEVSIDNYSSSLMLSLVMSSLLVSPPEAFFIFVMYNMFDC